MLAASSMPLAVPLFLLVVVASAVPATAEYSGARMVIIRSGPETRVGGGAASAQSNKWRRHYRRLEDEVATELGGLLGAGGSGGSIDYRPTASSTRTRQVAGKATSAPRVLVGPTPGHAGTRKDAPTAPLTDRPAAGVANKSRGAMRVADCRSGTVSDRCLMLAAR